MVLFIQQLITGLSIGGIYALLAVGYALIFSIFDFTNFAFGALVMTCAFAGYYAITAFGFSFMWGIVFAIVFGIAISVFTEIVAYRPLRQRKASRLFLMITAMGVDIFLVNLVIVLVGGDLKRFPGELSNEVYKLGAVSIGRLDIIAAVFSTIVLLILWFLLEKTKSGVAIRASAYDTATAGLMGINVNKISFIVFSISGAISAISGVFFGMKYAVYPTLGLISIKAFIASVIGGLGSIQGAVVGGIFLGVVETMVSGYISSIYRDLFAFSILVFALLFFPRGLFGKNIQDKI